VALADQLANGEEEAQLVRTRVDLQQPLLEVGDDVDARHPLVAGLGIDDVGGPVPVVADEDDVPDAARAVALGDSLRRRQKQRRRERGDRQRQCPP